MTSQSVATIAPSAEDDASLRARQEAAGGGVGLKRADPIAQTLLLAVLFAAPALMCVHAGVVSDPDIWWHLRTGEAILAQHAVPHVDSYSRGEAGSQWLAYSWLFEMAVAKLFQWLGLAGIVAYTSAMVLAVTVALFHLLRRMQVDFSLVVVLTFAGCFSMEHLYTPRPWFFTILFFILEMDVLMQARRTGRLRELLWLPPIFALWANVHIQFIDGLIVLGLVWVESVAGLWWKALETRTRPSWMGLALAGSLLATFVNPFGWRIYQPAYQLMTQAGALNKVTELQAIPFRSAADFMVLLLALGSAAALTWRRRFLLCESVLLIFAAVLAFRSQRDVWILAVVATAILASTITGREGAPILVTRLGTTLAMAVAAIVMLAGFRLMHVNNARLTSDLAKTMPVQAVERVKARGYGGPLFNDYNWGGYLIWALRMPVSIDGRQNVYGDQRMDRSVATWSAQPDWSHDEQLRSAGLVIGPAKAGLNQVLRMDPRFQLVYEDKVAAVFVARR